MVELKSKYDILVERLKSEGKVNVIDESTKDIIVGFVQKELDDYRFENQKRIRDSQEEIANVVLTA
jgi:hypothetical protein